MILIINTSGNGIDLVLNDNFVHIDAEKQAITLPNAVEDFLKTNRVSWDNISAIGVIVGPGSFTGIRLGIAYASYYNKRRQRTGPLFEGRFRSEPVDECDYFITLLHYIHYNPVKAGMTSKPGWYRWSSWHEYELPEDMVDRGFCQQNIPFKNYTRSQVKEIVLSAEDPKNFVSTVDKQRLDNQEAETFIKNLVPEQFKDQDLKTLPKVEKLAISNKAQDYGITYSQIISILGLNKSSIYRGKLKNNRLAK